MTVNWSAFYKFIKWSPSAEGSADGEGGGTGFGDGVLHHSIVTLGLTLGS